MSHTSFQDRLERIGAPITPPGDTNIAGRKKPKRTSGKPRYGLGLLGVVLMPMSLHPLKRAVPAYNALQDGTGVTPDVTTALFGALMLAASFFLILRAFPSKAARKTQKAQKVAQAQQGERVKASPAQRAKTSLIGFCLGALTTAFVWMIPAATEIGTERARSFVVGGGTILLYVGVLVLCYGIIGIFARGKSLGRVALFYIYGAVICGSMLYFFKVDMLEFPALVQLLQ